MNKKKLKIGVTSGGTRVFIDDFRCITNISSGKTGKYIGEECIKRRHTLFYMYGTGASIPFEDFLKVDVSRMKNSPVQEFLRLQDQSRKWVCDIEPKLKLLECRDFEEYQNIVFTQIQELDVIILAMAASDFGPKKIQGKVSSDQTGLQLQLENLPKIISQVKEINPAIFLVGFKALSNVSRDVLIKTAWESMIRDKQDLCVANLVSGEKAFEKFETFIVTREKKVIVVGRREDLAGVLVREVEGRL